MKHFSGEYLKLKWAQENLDRKIKEDRMDLASTRIEKSKYGIVSRK